MPSVKLPLRELAQVASVKLPLRENVWLLQGFILQENIISLKTNEIVLIENIKSFITTQIELVDRNHIKIKWFGDSVPKIQIWRRRIDEDYGTTPYLEVDWKTAECIIPIDVNGYVFKVKGVLDTGEGQEYQIGGSQDYEVNMNLLLPINQKNYYFDIGVSSVYRFEVNV